MIESGYYPDGAEFDKNAPYNQLNLKPEPVVVDVTITLTKTVDVNVDDYKLVQDYDDDFSNGFSIDLEDCDLERHVKEQVNLPQYDEKYKDWKLEDIQVSLN